MDNSFMVGLSAQQVLQQRMDLTANNLANMTTSGFKAEHLVLRDLSERPAAATEGPSDITFVDAWRLQRDMRAGALEATGNPLDLAIEGDGFFAIQTPAGGAYARDGRFMLDGQGRIVTRSGNPVLGEGGPITVNPDGGPISISREGSISQDGAILGTVKVVEFEAPDGLEKMGDNLWKATDQSPRAAANSRIAAGFVEASNVNPVAELTQMIEISRTYESISRMIAQSDQLRGESIEKLSRVG